MAYENATANMKTNYRVRELFAGDQIPFSLFVNNGQLDYIKPLSDEFYSYRFFKYLNDWYDIGQFEAMEPGKSYWQGVQPTSAFSAVFIRLADDSNNEPGVIVGRSHW